MKTHLNIDAGKRVTGDCKLSAVKRKEGRLSLRMSLTTIVEDDALADTVFAGPLQADHDRLTVVRKSADSKVRERTAFVKLAGDIGKVIVEPVFDGAPGARVADGIDGALMSVKVTGGPRHTKQVAVVDLFGTSEQLGKLLDVQDCVVRVRVKVAQAGLFDAGAADEDDEDLPDEPVGGEQLALAEGAAPEEPAVDNALGRKGPGRRRKTTDDEVAGA